MNCKNCQKQLYLYREGEQTEQQRIKTEKHLQSCPKCRTLAEQINRFNQSVQSLTEKAPVLNQSRTFTNQVMNSIQSIKKEHIRPVPDTPWNWLAHPVFRLAAGCVLVFMFSALFIQEGIVMNRISGLEKKIEYSTDVPKSALAWTINHIQTVELAVLNSYIDDLLAMIGRGDVPEKTLIPYMSLFNQLSPAQQSEVLQLVQSSTVQIPLVRCIIRKYGILNR